MSQEEGEPTLKFLTLTGKYPILAICFFNAFRINRASWTSYSANDARNVWADVEVNVMLKLYLQE